MGAMGVEKSFPYFACICMVLVFVFACNHPRPEYKEYTDLNRKF
jgi:hypothetical protein